MNVVDPASIEQSLQATWNVLAQEKKVRASTFNLIVFARTCPRIAYYRTVMQKVVQKFPCRILFITEEEKNGPFLQTATSVLSLDESPEIACDQIDVAVSHASMHQVPFLLLPHFVPDLPIYLLWTVDPKEEHPLFSSLTQWATRVIFDSESTDDLPGFAKKLLELKNAPKGKALHLADLNWARIEPWRTLFISLFDTTERLRSLENISSLDVVYNSYETPFFTHLTVQSLYLVSWLSFALGWSYQKKEKGTLFFVNKQKKEILVRITEKNRECQKPGTILSCHIKTSDGLLVDAEREEECSQRVKVQIATEQHCELPCLFPLSEVQLGQSLVKEIYTHATSHHFLGMLQQLVQIEG